MAQTFWKVVGEIIWVVMTRRDLSFEAKRLSGNATIKDLNVTVSGENTYSYEPWLLTPEAREWGRRGNEWGARQACVCPMTAVQEKYYWKY